MTPEVIYARLRRARPDPIEPTDVVEVVAHRPIEVRQRRDRAARIRAEVAALFGEARRAHR